MLGKFVFILLIPVFSCSDSPPVEYIKLDVIKQDKKLLLFENVQSKIGEAYLGTNAHFIYDCLKEVLDESEIPLFEDEISPGGIFDKSQPYKTLLLDAYFELGDIVFINRENINYSPFGFIKSYNFSLQSVSYICVINNRIALQTVQVDQGRISIRQLALKE
jgi:hypothetical protein